MLYRTCAIERRTFSPFCVVGFWIREIQNSSVWRQQLSFSPVKHQGAGVLSAIAWPQSASGLPVPCSTENPKIVCISHDIHFFQPCFPHFEECLAPVKSNRVSDFPLIPVFLYKRVVLHWLSTICPVHSARIGKQRWNDTALRSAFVWNECSAVWHSNRCFQNPLDNKNQLLVVYSHCPYLSALACCDLRCRKILLYQTQSHNAGSCVEAWCKFSARRVPRNGSGESRNCCRWISLRRLALWPVWYIAVPACPRYREYLTVWFFRFGFGMSLRLTGFGRYPCWLPVTINLTFSATVSGGKHPMSLMFLLSVPAV